MNRRDALTRGTVLLGGTIVGGTTFLGSCKLSDRNVTDLPVSPEQVAYLDEIAETIIPASDTPGAKAANVGAFIFRMLADCYEDRDQKTLIEGMNTIDAESQKKFGKVFMQASPEQRKELLTAIDKEASAYNERRKMHSNRYLDRMKKLVLLVLGLSEHHYFTLMKQLTLLGYFSSEIGATQARRYVPIPGKYEGCVPYKKGDKAWAT